MNENIVRSIDKKDYRVGSIVVTFFPDVIASNNIHEISRQSNFVVVVDNTPTETPDNLVNLPENVLLIRLEKNYGIAHALNVGMEEMINRNFNYTITFDQDSAIEKNYVKNIMEYFLCNDSVSHPILIVSPQYNLEGVKNSNRVIENHYLASTMTSGNLVIINRLLSIGLFESDYFIDYVDHEICLRARKYGYYIALAKGVYLNHSLGRAEQKKLLLKWATITHHASFRRYYMSRNRIRVYRAYFSFDKSWVLKDIWSIPLEATTILLYEDNKWQKINSMLRGFVEGLSETRSKKEG